MGALWLAQVLAEPILFALSNKDHSRELCIDQSALRYSLPVNVVTNVFPIVCIFLPIEIESYLEKIVFLVKLFYIRQNHAQNVQYGPLEVQVGYWLVDFYGSTALNYRRITLHSV